MAAPCVWMLPMNAHAPEIADMSPTLIGDVSVAGLVGPSPHAETIDKATMLATAAGRRKCDFNLDSPFSMTPSGPVQADLCTNPRAPQKNRADVVSPDFGRRPLEVVASVDQQIDPVGGIESEVDVLLDDDHRSSARRYPFDLFPHDLRVGRRQPGRGLVKQPDRRVDHQRPSHATQLSLTPAQRTGPLEPGLIEIWKDLDHVADAFLEPVLARLAPHPEFLADGQPPNSLLSPRHA